MKFLSLIICLFAFGITACNQDPLENYPRNVQNAQPPGSEKPKPSPGKIVVEPIGVLTFTEDVETTVRIEYRTIGLDVPTAASMIGLPDGASFDASKNELTWRPALGTVGSKGILVVPMQILVQTTEEPFITITERVNFSVIRNSGITPEVSLPMTIGDMTEGSYESFQVTVRDVYSDKNNPPKLHSFRAFSTDLSVFARFSDNPTQDQNDPTLWRFGATLDLGATEMTTDETKLSLSAYAVSSVSGAASSVSAMNVNVLTKLNLPSFSLPDGEILEVAKGLKQQYSFLVSTPTNIKGQREGKITQLNFETACNQISAVKSCTCRIKNNQTGICTLDLHPTGASADSFNLKVSGRIEGSTVKITVRDFDFNIPVKVTP